MGDDVVGAAVVEGLGVGRDRTADPGVDGRERELLERFRQAEAVETS